ncbi:MAG: CYTH domain-containing protein [Syntrophales bacterium]
MAVEIERKFLLCSERWREKASPGVFYRQGYVCTEKEYAVRVRIAGNRGYLSVKGAVSETTRREYEYEIPRPDAEEMLSFFCRRRPLEKIRRTVDYEGKTWEIDEFLGENAGLVIAEIELQEEGEPFDMPDWAGPEITKDERYLSVNLYLRPFTSWGKNQAEGVKEKQFLTAES